MSHCHPLGLGLLRHKALRTDSPTLNALGLKTFWQRPRSPTLNSGVNSRPSRPRPGHVSAQPAAAVEPAACCRSNLVDWGSHRGRSGDIPMSEVPKLREDRTHDSARGGRRPGSRRRHGRSRPRPGPGRGNVLRSRHRRIRSPSRGGLVRRPGRRADRAGRRELGLLRRRQPGPQVPWRADPLARRTRRNPPGSGGGIREGSHRGGLGGVHARRTDPAGDRERCGGRRRPA